MEQIAEYFNVVVFQRQTYKGFRATIIAGTLVLIKAGERISIAIGPDLLRTWTIAKSMIDDISGGKN